MIESMQMREAAERVLFAQSLEEKLRLVPEHASDDSPGKAVIVPQSPGRPDELIVSAKGVKADFPGVNRLDNDQERGKMMHFLANHELLAAELMALVLLKFPDAPKEYRQGVYEAMREEQIHTLMYMRRMRDCGISFGELPVNDYFWRLISPMQTPMDFVTRLNLTFEQSNLDFSKHYAGLFRQVGDTGTAAVLEKIYQDEIGHVGHGVKWFRKWKDQGQSDWQAFKTSLSFPMSPAKAKGIAPFNAEGRRLAGLDEDFIGHLEVCEQSRGRTPVLHWFNPNAESETLAAINGHSYCGTKVELALEHDLEMLMLSRCRRDDTLLLRRHPGNAHMTMLKKEGIELPEIVVADESYPHMSEELRQRKLGGMRPWAWTAKTTEQLAPYAGNVSAGTDSPWLSELPHDWWSKRIGVELVTLLDLPASDATYCPDRASALAAIESYRMKGLLQQGSMQEQKIQRSGDVLIKSAYACAGRGHRKIMSKDKHDDFYPWLNNTLTKHQGVVVEPWLDRVLDFSALYDMNRQGEVRYMGMTKMINDSAGRFLGTVVYPKWGTGIDPELAEFLFKKAGVMPWYREKIPQTLVKLLPTYVGPIGVDAMVYRKADGSLGLRHVVEVNVRMTMGRVALELQKKSTSGRSGKLQILRKKAIKPSLVTQLSKSAVPGVGVAINNPVHAKEFIVVWETS